jgi:Cu/Ag efflux pump CusA
LTPRQPLILLKKSGASLGGMITAPLLSLLVAPAVFALMRRRRAAV